jgi:hypothetical protein
MQHRTLLHVGYYRTMQGHDDAAARLRALLNEPSEAEALARSWVARGEALSVRALFPELLRSIVEESDDASLLGGLRALTSLARGGHAGARMMSQELALNVEVFSRVPYERLVELYALAIDADAAGRGPALLVEPAPSTGAPSRRPGPSTTSTSPCPWACAKPRRAPGIACCSTSSCVIETPR